MGETRVSWVNQTGGIYQMKALSNDMSNISWTTNHWPERLLPHILISSVWMSEWNDLTSPTQILLEKGDLGTLYITYCIRPEMAWVSKVGPKCRIPTKHPSGIIWQAFEDVRVAICEHQKRNHSLPNFIQLPPNRGNPPSKTGEKEVNHNC